MRIACWVLGILFLLIGLGLIALPTAIEDYVEEHDQELMGREISIADVEMNYFTMTVQILDFVLAESESDTTFVSFEMLEVNMNPWALLKNTIHLESIRLVGPYAQVIQNGKQFNFNDLKGEESNEPDTTVSGEPWHFIAENFVLSRGSIAYESDLQPRMQFDSIRIDAPLISDTTVVMIADVSLDVSTGGKMKLHNEVNTELTTYDVHLDADQLSLHIVESYIEPFLEIGELEGFLSANFTIEGNWENDEIFNLGGDIKLEDLALTNIRDEAVFSLALADIDIDTIRMGEGLYNVEYLKLDGLYGIYEMYGEDDDNISQMIVETNAKSDSTVIAVTDSMRVNLAEAEAEIDYANPFSVLSYYIKDLAKSYKESDYKFGEISVTNGSFDFSDYTLTDPFKYEFDNLEIHADSLASTAESLTFNMSAMLNNTGTFEGYIRLYTENLEDLDMYYEIRGTALTPFSPYTREYIDYPIVLGDLVFVNETKIKDRVITSSNVLDCLQFNFGDRVDGDAPYSLPVKLALSLLKDLDGNIHIDIPVEGDLKDPEFKLGKVIWQVVKNILTKAITSPYRLLAKQIGVDEESLKQVDFNLLSLKLQKSQEKKLDNLAKVIDSKEGLNVEFKRVTKKYAEVERYAVNESKFRYLYKNEEPPEPDEVSPEVLEAIQGVDLMDSLFIRFVDTKLDEIDRSLPIQKKCMIYVGEERAIAKTDRVGAVRSKAIADYLIEEKQVPSERIRFTVLSEDSLIVNRSSTIYHVGFWVEE